MLSPAVGSELLIKFRPADEVLHRPTTIRTRRYPLPRRELPISDPSTNRPHRATGPLRRLSCIQPGVSGGRHHRRCGIGGPINSRVAAISRLHLHEIRPPNEIRHRSVELFSPQPGPPHSQLVEHLLLLRMSLSQDGVAARHHGDLPSTAIGLRGRYRHVSGVSCALHQPRRAALVDTDLARNGVHGRGLSTVNQGSRGLQHRQKSAWSAVAGSSLAERRDQCLTKLNRSSPDPALLRRAPLTASSDSKLMTEIVCVSHAFDWLPRARRPRHLPRMQPVLCSGDRAAPG